MKYLGRSAKKLLITKGLAGLAGLLLSPALWGQVSVLTWHNDAARTGQNLQETVLTPSNVNSTNFGKLFQLPTSGTLDGKVDAQPLYVPSLSINSGTHNVVYVATENDTVYAFDADNGATLWSQSLLLSGENVVQATDSQIDGGQCTQVTPTIGITSTPVIDLASGPHGTIYVVAMSKDGSGNFHQRLHALDLINHTEEFGGPVNIAATYPGTGDNSSNGSVVFDPKQYKDRAALALSNGIVYTSWASHCDAGLYTAWIIGYNESSLAQASVLNLSPNGHQASIWQAGAGPAVDAGGNLYALMANGTFDTTMNSAGFPTNGDYGNGFMKLSTGTALAVADYFATFNAPTEDEPQVDQDLGSGGPMLLPTLADAMGHSRELAVGAGKDGIAYVVDRNNMGKFNPTNDNAIYQEFGLSSSVFSSPAWFNNNLYYGPNGQVLSAYPYSGGFFGSAASQTGTSFTYPGTTPSISANGSSNGIVWAMENTSVAVLHAYDATNLSSELYNSNQAASSRDHFGMGNKYMVPTVANGKVFAAATSSDNSSNVVGVFGLLSCSYGASVSYGSQLFSSSAVSSASFSVPAGSGCSWSATTSSNFITITGGASGTGPGSVSYSIPANPGATRTGVIVVAGHTYTVTQTGDGTLSAPSSPSPANGANGISINPTLTWAASSGATSYDVYFGTSSAPSFVQNVVSASYTPATLTPGITYYWMVVAKNSSGNANSSVWNFTTTEATTNSVTPSSGSTISQTFALQYSDTAGATSLRSVYAYFNATLASPASNSCFLFYNVAANQIDLLNDGGTAYLTATPGTATTLQNSQCSLNLATTTVAPNGSTLVLNLAVTFKSAYAGTKNIYMYATDVSGSISGWQTAGSWIVPAGSGTPSAVSVTPSSGSAASQNFALKYSDTAGASNLKLLYAYFNATLASPASNSCFVYYSVAANQINLLNDAGTAYSTAVLGAATTLQNGHCSVNVAATTAVPSGNNLTLNLAMAFAPAYAGTKNIYMYATDISGSNSGWQTAGSWIVPVASGTPSAVSVTPSSGSVASQNFALQYSDTAGAASLQLVYVYFNATLASPASNACFVFYGVAANQINLLNDAGTAYSTAVPGAPTTLQNSQCSVNVAATTVVPSGNTLTLNLAMTFNVAFSGTKNIYLYATDISGAKSGWQTLGSWTVPSGSGTPVAESATPNAGSVASQNFTLQYSDTAGAAHLQSLYVYFNATLASPASNACFAFYSSASNQINLLNSAGTAYQTATPGAATTLQNSQCSVNVAATTVVPSGNTLTLNLAMTFNQAFGGSKNIYLYATDVSGANSGWQNLGTWMVP